MKTAIVALAIATAVVYPVTRLIDSHAGLAATYFDDVDWQHRGGASAAPEVPSTDVLQARHRDFEREAFSVEWRGFITIPRRGTYAFRTVSDDGSWVYVHGREAVASPGRHAAIEARGAPLALDAGVHSIYIRYFQDRGDCAFEVSWSRNGGPFEPIPAWLLTPERVSYPHAMIDRAAGLLLILIVAAWYAAAIVMGLRLLLRAADRPVRWVVGVSTALNAWGIWWAMPNTRGWAPDEVVPPDVLAAVRVLFSHGWHEKYPPFHYAVLAAAESPMLLLSSVGLVDLQATPTHVLLVLIGRLLAVALAAGTIVVVYRCGAELFGSRGAVFAALITALTIPFAYYGKLANLDVPYLFWFAVSLLAYVRILRRHQRRDYLIFACSAMLAACTKDQAWGLYFLTAIAILAARWRARRPILDTVVWQAIAVGLATFVVADNLLFNAGGFIAHVRLTLETAAPVREFPRTVGGELRMAWRSVVELRYMFGWPVSAVIAVALADAVRRSRTDPSLRWLLVPALSYVVTFLAVILLLWDRYLLPIAIVFALCGGWWLGRFVADGVRARRARLALVWAVFAYTVVYVAGIDYAMTFDSRYAVTQWLQAHARRTDVVGALGPLEFQMIAGRFRSASIDSPEAAAALRPQFIVLNADMMPVLPEPVQTLHAALLAGRAGYRLALRVRTPPLPLPGQHPDLGASPRHPEYSDLSMINPTMEVFERASGDDAKVPDVAAARQTVAARRDVP